MRPPRRRGLDAGEAELWRRVAETVKPLKSRRRRPAPPGEPGEAQDAAPPAAGPRPPVPEEGAEAPARGRGRAGAPPRPAPPVPPPAPPLNAVDRRLVQRVGRGSRSVDAAVDLHGMTQREAHDRLLGFLRAAQGRGHRLVLVVTGKGSAEAAPDWWEEGARGVLRRAVPEWLATPPFRALVVGYRQAHARKGGEGAIYVQIRRRERRRGP